MSVSTPVFNLLPETYRIRIARQQAVSRWTTALVILAAVCYVPAGAVALGTRAQTGPTHDRLERGQAKIAQLNAAKPALQQRLTGLANDVAVYAVVEDRIDWRPLLGSIAEVAPPARFERIAINPDPTESRAEVMLYGLVDTIFDARALVLRLEETGVYQTVSLVNTSSVSLPQSEVVRFEIRASIVARKEGS